MLHVDLEELRRPDQSWFAAKLSPESSLSCLICLEYLNGVVFALILIHYDWLLLVTVCSKHHYN